MIRLRNYGVKRGEFTIDIPELNLVGRRNFIIGKNGSGKTTILQSLAGLIESSGVFEVNGVDLSELPPERRRVGYLPQDLLLFGNMTVDNNLKSSIKYGRGKTSIYAELVARMDLTKLLKKRTGDISFGQAQRVAIARAIISNPAVLLMDEPFSFQDEISRLGLISLIDELSTKYDFDYLYATHNSRDLETGFSSLVSIDGGRVIEAVESVSMIQHYRTLSLLDYRNLVSIDGHYYVINWGAMEFSDTEGSEYDIVGIEPNKYLRFKIGDNYHFSTLADSPTGRFVRVNTEKAREIVF